MKRVFILLSTCAITCCLRAAEPTPSPTPAPTLSSVLLAHRATLQWDTDGASAGRRLRGAAAEQLINEARQSQFFLIGEDHGGAETARFAEAMFQAIRPLGYNHIAIEAGPLTGEVLEKGARSGGADAIGAFLRGQPFAVPFFNWREEAEYLAATVKAVSTADTKPGNQHVVWGLDQEFILSPSIHLARLTELAKGLPPAAQETVREFKARSEAGYAEMVAKKNPNAIWMMQVATADFDKLAAAFPKEGEAARIIGELRESAEIYQLWLRREGYRSNELRAALMNRHFNAFYREAVAHGEAMPRVMMKFGANHMMRGRSFVDVFDLGTFLPELARQNGGRVFQMLVLGRKGHVNNHRPFSPDAADKSAVYEPNAEVLSFDPTPLFAAAVPDAWTLLDLRPVRPLLSADQVKVDAALQRILWGYDAVVIIPEVHAATLFE